MGLVLDDERRRRAGRAALRNSRRFTPGPVLDQAECLSPSGPGEKGSATGRAHPLLVSQGFAARDALSPST
ncbi:hypothetical protein AB0D27_30715 [Streptomyces sp. NPDC048415]|uniref:hypothetical protein n=1 Tax=Streptomyces sp. NPDC048415 TaxID=3154822 RepID=UPI0034244D87